MDRDFLAEVKLVGDRLHRPLHGGFTHRRIGLRDTVLAQLMVATVGWEEPPSMAVGRPVGSQQFQRRRRQRNVAILGTLATVDVNQSTSGVDVTDLQVEPLVQTQSHGVDGPKVDKHPLRSGRGDQPVHSLDREHFGQGVDVLQPEHSNDFPVPFAGDGEEELDAREGDAKRPVGEAAVEFQVQKELPDLHLVDFVGAALREIGQLADGSNVAIVGPFGLATQVQVLGESLPKFGWEEGTDWIGAALVVRLGHRSFPVAGGVDELSTANSSSCQDALEKSPRLNRPDKTAAAIAAYLNHALHPLGVTRSGKNKVLYSLTGELICSAVTV